MIRTEKTWHRGIVVASLAAAAALVGASNASATGTDKTENLILATGVLDGRNEMVICLDIVSGTLKGFVINTNSRQFFAEYTAATVAADLDVPKGRNPKYSLVTGISDFKPTGAGGRLGQCVIYVAEETSGNMVAYAAPWDPSAMSRNQPVKVPFVKLGVVKVGAGGPAGAGAVQENK
jgi:hypothetical protein